LSTFFTQDAIIYFKPNTQPLFYLNLLSQLFEII